MDAVTGLLSMWKQHTVSIEPYLGTDGYGRKQYGQAMPVQGWLEETRKVVRNKDGAEVVSSTQLHCDLGADVPELSKGTLPSGKVTEVVAVSHLDGQTLPLPSHLQVAFE
ncbi:hypothetical protein [Glycomyces arizonensis]|uniref:hypothetical protein n=1 Tax=Glycomyces arizonensis TaxID=256035 RepID=UPI000478AF12|nr:hypothetical protein [Glycomyces arizonensis]